MMLLIEKSKYDDDVVDQKIKVLLMTIMMVSDRKIKADDKVVWSKDQSIDDDVADDDDVVDQEIKVLLMMLLKVLLMMMIADWKD